MSDQSQGPGWWVASDGRWYPPEQAPGGPPAAPDVPSLGMGTGAKIGIGIAVALMIVMLLGAAVALLGDSDSPSSTPVTNEIPTSFTRFADPDGAFSIDLHPDWLPLSLRGDVESVGTEAAPDDAERASLIDALVATLPRQVVFAAVDGTRIDGPEFKPNMNLIPIPRDGAGLSEIEVQIPLSVEAFGATGAKVTRIATRLGEGLRMTYRFDGDGPLAGVEGIQYYLFGDDTVWVLTVTSDEMASDVDDFESSVASFRLR